MHCESNLLKEGPKTHMASNRHRNGLPPAGWRWPGFPRKQEGVPRLGRNLLGRAELGGDWGKASRAQAPLIPGSGRGCQRGAGVSPVGHPKRRDWAAVRLTWGVRLKSYGEIGLRVHTAWGRGIRAWGRAGATGHPLHNPTPHATSLGTL